MAKPLIPVILAGGSGARLWPLSRQLYPKQFLPLLGEKTMLQQTIERLQGLDCQAPIVVCGGEKKQARTFSMSRPSSKNPTKPLRENICKAAPLLLEQRHVHVLRKGVP